MHAHTVVGLVFLLQGKQVLMCLVRTKMNALTLVAGQPHAVLLPDPDYAAVLRGNGELSYCVAPSYLEKLAVPHAQTHATSYKITGQKKTV